jgi:hypothetical protein
VQVWDGKKKTKQLYDKLNTELALQPKMQAFTKGFINYSEISSIVFYKHMQIEDDYLYFKPKKIVIKQTNNKPWK